MQTDTAILATISYFDTFDFALTPEEIFSFLWSDKANLDDCYGALRRLTDKQTLETKDSYFFLPGRFSTVKRRQESVMPTEERLTRAKSGARLIRWLPFVRAIFVCNSVAAEMAVSRSDIDFFIVTAEGRVWMVRFLTNVVLKIFGLRTNAEHSDNHICLSFFVTEKNLNLAPWRVANDDIYLAIWLRQLYPLYDPEQQFSRKVQSENNWVQEFLPNTNLDFYKISEEVYWKHDLVKKFLEWCLGGSIGEFFERQLRRLQWANLRPGLKEKAKSGGVEVVLNDGILKFHENDARRCIRERWLAKCLSFRPSVASGEIPFTGERDSSTSLGMTV